MSKNIIKKIELDIDGKVVRLTPEQAKKLKSALDELFGKKVEKEYVPYPQPYPVIPWRRIWAWDYRPTYYTTTSGTLCNYSSDNSTLKITV